MKKLTETEHVYHLFKNNVLVGEVRSFDAEQAVREIYHYAAVYSMDGPVTIKIKPKIRRQLFRDSPETEVKK